MTKKKKSLTIDADLSGLFSQPKATKATPTQPSERIERGMTIVQALNTIIRQMEVSGHRARTISDYRLHVNHFVEVTGVNYLNEITANHIYTWLHSMSVSNQTKLTRLKCLKAFLSKCFNNGWLHTKFWTNITIKVDNKVKEGATDREVNLLLSLLDLNDFVQLRDAAALLLMYQTGLRIGTVSRLENRHVDLEAKLLRIDGDIVKNHQQIHLPLSDELTQILRVLMRQNDIIRREYGEKNEFVFITKNGGRISTSPSHNNIQKRLNKYAKMYNLKNINPHALRRGFAKNLLNKGANIAIISKALGHSDIAVTTKYLHLDKEEVANSLREFLY